MQLALIGLMCEQQTCLRYPSTKISICVLAFFTSSVQDHQNHSFSRALQIHSSSDHLQLPDSHQLEVDAERAHSANVCSFVVCIWTTLICTNRKEDSIFGEVQHIKRQCSIVSVELILKLSMVIRVN